MYARHQATLAAIAWADIHCAAGDVLIALVTFALAAIVAGRVDWPWRSFGRGLPVMILSGVAQHRFQ